MKMCGQITSKIKVQVLSAVNPQASCLRMPAGLPAGRTPQPLVIKSSMSLKGLKKFFWKSTQVSCYTYPLSVCQMAGVRVF